MDNKEDIELRVDIHGYEGLYQVSSLGNIIALYRTARNKRVFKERTLTPVLHHSGYCIIGLYINGASKIFGIHRLIAIAFIPNPENKPYINHKNGIKTDNRIENLEWATGSENTSHAYSNGLTVANRGASHPHTRFTEADVIDIKTRLKNGELASTIHRDHYPHVGATAIYRLKQDKSWRHIKI